MDPTALDRVPMEATNVPPTNILESLSGPGSAQVNGLRLEDCGSG